MSADYVIPAPPQAVIAVAGTSKTYPVRRIWCVGRNYIEHIREMGQDERLPPFYFAKAADMIVPDKDKSLHKGAVVGSHDVTSAAPSVNDLLFEAATGRASSAEDR